MKWFGWNALLSFRFDVTKMKNGLVQREYCEEEKRDVKIFIGYLVALSYTRKIERVS